MADHPEPHENTPDAPPPILGSWVRLYATVLGALLGWILFFAWLTERYS